ncbi:hypothetical protein O6P43_006966 [Quillaja saponaria]|uniref:Uncharacterized protein n=1 Tax=Quillaja saponaria TaxID=32244 RepID=A0AAD7VJ03_QUISA|nr:hypothetical protein O6P43_006966 [Quillaja saponaria]
MDEKELLTYLDDSTRPVFSSVGASSSKKTNYSHKKKEKKKKKSYRRTPRVRAESSSKLAPKTCKKTNTVVPFAFDFDQSKKDEYFFW